MELQGGVAAGLYIEPEKSQRTAQVFTPHTYVSVPGMEVEVRDGTVPEARRLKLLIFFLLLFELKHFHVSASARRWRFETCEAVMFESSVCLSWGEV